jgi:hypothetical protein
MACEERCKIGSTMGMFDYIQYNGNEYQTKDTPTQMCDHYKIEADQDDGHSYLWFEEYDTEMVKDDTHLLGVYFNDYNHHWLRCDFTGTISFYRMTEEKNWEDLLAEFENGRLIKINSGVTE